MNTSLGQFPACAQCAISNQCRQHKDPVKANPCNGIFEPFAPSECMVADTFCCDILFRIFTTMARFSTAEKQSALLNFREHFGGVARNANIFTLRALQDCQSGLWQFHLAGRALSSLVDKHSLKAFRGGQRSGRRWGSFFNFFFYVVYQKSFTCPTLDASKFLYVPP